MPSTYSPNLGFELPAAGEQAGTWGTTVNTNIGTLIEQAIGGIAVVQITDGADTTVTIPDGATGVARNMVLDLRGSLTANRVLLVPAKKKLYFIQNNTDNGYWVTVKVSGQSGVAVPNGKSVVLLCDGVDVYVATNYLLGDISGNAATATLAVTATTALACSGNAATATTATTATTASSVTNGVYTNQFYPDPAWITSLSSTKLSGSVAITKGGTGANDAPSARTNLGVPSLTGTNASGTWNISILGNAATATSVGSSGSFTMSLREGSTGGTVIASGMAYWVKMGKIVHLRIPQLYATSSQQFMFLTGMPADIVVGTLSTLSAQRCILAGLNNTSDWLTAWIYEGASYLDLRVGAAPTNFTASSGSKGTSGENVITYMISD